MQLVAVTVTLLGSKGMDSLHMGGAMVSDLVLRSIVEFRRCGNQAAFESK